MNSAQSIAGGAALADSEAISFLVTELGYPTTPAAMNERLKAILGDANSLTLVAEAGGTVVGLAGATLGRYYEKDGLYSWLVVLVVAKEARGKGIGSQLVEAVER